MSGRGYVRRSRHGSGDAIRTNLDRSACNGFVCFELETVAITQGTEGNKPAD